MSQQDPYERIRIALQQAALDGADWPVADRLISEVSRTEGSAVLFADFEHPGKTAVFLAQFSLRGQRREDWERRYFTEYWREDERVPRAFQLPPGHVAHTRQLYTDREKKTSPTYNEALPVTRAQNGLHLRMVGPRRSHIVWIACDSTERGGWTSGQIRLIQQLGPHVQQYVVVRHALAEVGLVGSSIIRLMENTRLGVIYLDRRGRIMAANDRVLTILRKGDGLVDRNGSLGARRPADDAELSRLLARAFPPSGVQGCAGSMLVEQSSSVTRLVLRITPVDKKYPRLTGRRIGALVLILDPSSRARVDPAVVSAALGLTPSESRLAVALAAGDTPNDIAGSTGRTEEGVREHLEQILSRQGLAPDVDLVRRVLALEDFPGEHR